MAGQMLLFAYHPRCHCCYW